MISKTGKQLMVKNYENYKVVSGTVDNKNPKALYTTISAWGESMIDDETINYTLVIRDLTKQIKKVLHEELDSTLFINNRCIVDFDMRESGISYGKRSYMNCEITFFQKHSFKLQEKKIQAALLDILNKVTKGVLDRTKYFEYHKEKK